MAGILRLIERERQGNSVDRMLCSELLRMLTSLGLYESSFQQDFLDDSQAFYEAEGLSKLQSSDIPAYLLHCEVHLTCSLSLVILTAGPCKHILVARAVEHTHLSCPLGLLS